MKSRIKIVLSISVFFATFSACKKENSTEPIVTTDGVQKMKLHIHNTIGNDALKFGSVYTDNASNKFKVTQLKYYISNIKFIKSDGTELSSSIKTLLIDPSKADYSVGELPVGDYKGIKFYVGLDSITNHADPTLFEATNPLAIQSPSMHWNWNSGYIFLRFEGMTDTTTAKTGTFDTPLIYHLGMERFLTKVDLSTSAFTVTSAAEKELVLKFDVKTLLSGLNLKTETITHTMDKMMVAEKLKNTIGKSFTIGN